MPVVKIDNTKGLYEALGTGLTVEKVTQALEASDVIDTSKGMHVVVTSTEALTVLGAKNVTLKDGTSDGQLLLLTNGNGSGGDVIEFAADHLSVEIAGGATVVAGNSVLFVWNGSKWSPTSQSL